MASLSQKLQREFSPWSLTTLVIGAFVLIPFIIVFASAFQSQENSKWAHLSSTVLGTYFWNTIILISTVSLISLLFAVLPAWLIAACQFPGRNFFSWALILPLAIPTYIVAFVYYSIPEASIPLLVKIRQTWGIDVYLWAEKILRYGVLSIIMASVLFPYLYISIRTSFAEQRRSVIEAARTLGRGPASIFFTVALPLARPAVVAGLTLIVMEVINDYGAVNFFGVPTLTEGIFRTWFGLGDRNSALRIAGICMFVVILILFAERWQRGSRRFTERSDHSAKLAKYQLSGLKALLATLACLIPLAIGFLYPVFQLLRWALKTYQKVLTWDFIEQLFRTLSLSLFTAVILTLAGLLFTYALKLHNHGGQQILTRLATVGYAAPGAVIAVGVMILFAFIDRLSPSKDLYLSGTVFIIISAYFIRFLTVAFEPIKAGMTRVCGHLNDASQALSKGPLYTLWRIDLPLLKSTLIAATMLVFVDILKELPLTMLLRPANFETLATTAFGYAKEGQIYESSVPSLLIIALGVFGLLGLKRFAKS